MVSLRGLQSSSTVTGSFASMNTEINTSTNSAIVAPSSNFTSVTTKKQTTSSGEVLTTVTTTTVSTSTSSASSSSTSTRSATEGSAAGVSATTITTTEGDNGASPVTTVVTENGVNTTRTSTTKDAVTGITTVATTTETDSDMNGSASRSTTWVSTSGVSGTSQETSSAAGAVSERVSTSKITSASSTTEENSVSSTTNSAISTGSDHSARTILTSGPTNSDSAATSSSTGMDSTGTSTSTSTSTTTATNSLTGSTYGAASSSTGSKGSITTEGSAASSKTSSSTESSKVSTNSATNSLSGSGFVTASSASSNSSTSSSSLTSWFTSNFRDEETQLVVGAVTSTTTAEASQVCDGLPALVTRSSTETPNGGCPDELTALNASCTCITGYSETVSSWAFHVTTESWNSTTTPTTRSLTQSSSSELAVNTISSIWVSSSLETLEIEGVGETPAEITFINENREDTGSSLTLVRSESNSTNVSTLSIYNVDLNFVAEKNSNFVPATVTTLILRSCNISTLSHSFTRNWSWLQYLDLSSNSIDTEYIGGAYLKELNLSHNALAEFPTGSLNTSGLEALYIQGNNIKNFNVSQDQFEQIQGLTAFTADKPDSSSTCEEGAWQSAHGTTFCVRGASTAAVPDSSRSSESSSDDDSSRLGLLSYWLIAGAIIVFFLLLLVLWQRRRQNHEHETSPIVSPDAVEANTPKVIVNAAFGDDLNRDNADVVAPTASFGALGATAYPGYGRSHGNSVDSEDTALGASLTNSQVLASCRLDYDEGKTQENEILRLVARGAKRPAFSDDCPPAILELAARCLRSDPEERPSASDIVVYLQQVVQERTSGAFLSSMVRPGQSLDFITNFSSSTGTAPANTIVNLRSSTQQNQATSVSSSTAATYASGKRTKKSASTTATTKVVPAGEALTPTHEIVASSPQVTQKVVRTNLPKGKRTTTTTTTTWRAKQRSTSGTTGSSASIGMAAGSSDGDNSGLTFGTESTPSSRSHARLGPTSPSSLRSNQATLDNLNQQRQLSSSSGKEAKKSSSQAVGIDRRGEKWIVYEDVKEL
ncbi:hypothetical protein PC128_g5665 [Phytophthora cactorum]|nr:hypothetical protein PC128_g5665 [Phytophthora cactorum]KAG4063704.1 hypothetical protein PC123_g1481 [Phytophthora cactorum]